MQAISVRHCCLFGISCPTKSVENARWRIHVEKTRVSRTVSGRATTVSVRASRGSEERRSSTHCNGRRLFLSVALSGAAFFTRGEGNSTVFAAEEEEEKIVEFVSPGSITSEKFIEPELPAVSEVPAPEEGAAPEAQPAEGNALIRKLLARSRENKEKNDKARLDDYYKRNYKEYFEYIEGTIRNKTEEELTETEKGIIEWLKKNK